MSKLKQYINKQRYIYLAKCLHYSKLWKFCYIFACRISYTEPLVWCICFQIKCRNVFVLSGTTIDELGLQWQCLLELSKGTDLLENKQQFISVRLHTSVPEVIFCLLFWCFTQFLAMKHCLYRTDTSCMH